MRRSLAPQLESVGEATHGIGAWREDLSDHGDAALRVTAGEGVHQALFLRVGGTIPIPGGLPLFEDEPPPCQLRQLLRGGGGAEAKLGGHLARSELARTSVSQEKEDLQALDAVEMVGEEPPHIAGQV